MSDLWRASAPGKLILAGEYAVLAGAPAISAAVDIRASATVALCSGSVSELCIANDGGRYHFTVSAAGEISWQENPAEQGTLLAAALRMLASTDQLSKKLPALSVQLCTGDFYRKASGQPARKIGAGSSAALAVALVASLQAAFGQEAALAECLETHRLFQDGKGSGIDVATSWHGGVIAMTGRAAQLPQVQSLAWPTGLCVQPVWTGLSASTVELLGRLEEYCEQSGSTREQVLQGLQDAAEQTLDCWSAGESQQIVAALESYGALLGELDQRASLGIWSERHCALRDLAARYGVGYKPSGAGGGDFGIAYATDESAVNDFVSAVHQQITPQLDEVVWTNTGVVCESVDTAAGQADA